MRLGISTWALPWAFGVPGYWERRGPTAADEEPLTVDGFLALAAELGLNVVQLADNAAYARAGTAQLAGWRETAFRSGVSIELGMRGTHADEIRRHLELCRVADSPLLRCVLDSSERDSRAHAEAVRRLVHDAVPDLMDTGVVLAVENHERLTTQQLLAVVRSANDAAGKRVAGVCLDTVNSFGAMEDPRRVIDALAPETVSLHLKEFAIHRQDHQMGFVVQGAPLGTGRLDVPNLVARLDEIGLCRTAVVEQWTPPEPTRAATRAKELSWLRDGIAHVRGWFE
jgi:sugar phosphate isomerase/epimerase